MNYFILTYQLIQNMPISMCTGRSVLENLFDAKPEYPMIFQDIYIEVAISNPTHEPTQIRPLKTQPNPPILKNGF